MINFDIEKTDEVRLEIFNILGERIKVLVNEKLNAGNHSFRFNANGLATGVYTVVLSTNEKIFSKKMLLMK